MSYFEFLDPQYAPMRSAERIQIVRLEIFETGSYNTQYRRPYTTANMNPESLNELKNRISHPDLINSNLFSGLAGGLLSVDNTPECQLNITNGWGERRLAFMMEILVKMSGSKDYKHFIVNGWGEHADRSYNNNFDTRMRFEINTILELGNSSGIDSYGNVMKRPSVRSMHHVFNNQNYAGGLGEEVRIQPSDVLLQMSTRDHYHDDLQSGNVSIVHTETVNGRSPSKVNRQYNNVNNYLADTVGSFARVRGTSYTAGTNSSFGEICNAAVQHTGFTLSAHDPFMRALGNLHHDRLASPWFNFEDLKKLDPNVANVTRVTYQQEMPNNHTYHQAHADGQRILGEDWSMAGQSDSMGGNGIENHFAAMVAHGVPQLMMEFFFEGAHFTATNRTMNGRTQVVFQHLQPFTDFSYRDLVPVLEDRLSGELFNDASRNGLLEFEITVNCSLTREIHIMLSIDGQAPTYVVVPAFCDALMTPMITAEQRGALFADAMSDLINEVVMTKPLPKQQVGHDSDFMNNFGTYSTGYDSSDKLFN